MKRSYMRVLTAAVMIACWPSEARDARAGEVQLCLAQAADYSAVYPTTTFPVGSTEDVAAVVRLSSGESYRTLVATWTVIEAGNGPRNQVINKVTVPMQGKDRAVVHMRSKAGPLPPGKYRLDVAANDKPWRSLEFAVAPVEPPVVRAPDSLLPLKPGTVWRYAFVQQFAPGVRPTLPPGTKLESDGTLRATLEKSAAGQDDLGVHIQARRNGALVEEEWWKLTDAGLVVTKLKSGGEEQTFDPPGALWPWPLKTPRRWEYEIDASLKQTFRMWGPVSLKGPSGTAPGYVVLMQQPSQPIALSGRTAIPPRRRHGPGGGGPGTQRRHADALGERADAEAMTAPQRARSLERASPAPHSSPASHPR
jgi:hypothetical protein